MLQPHKLEILLTWLEDNENMGTDLFFADGVDSADMLPAVRAAVELLNMPKAEKYAPPWIRYEKNPPDIEGVHTWRNG
ncbi:hypothetical protein [Kluyvera ascorbata]|uniref:hypothetical protein n=1 Tax=Kluyvera ascorbata TaxID=51288 RepID=UPI0039F711DA